MISPSLAMLSSFEPASLAGMVSPEAIDRSAVLSGLMPEAFSSFYWECRLGKGEDQVDFLASVNVACGGRHILAEEEFKLPNSTPNWNRVKAFIKEWNRPDSIYYATVPNIWFEFDDVGNPAEMLSAPCISFCQETLYFRRRYLGNAALPAGPPAFHEVAVPGLELLLGGAMPPALRINLEKCQKHLPPGGNIIHLSVMFGRNPETVKVYLVLPKDSVMGYLERVGWTGSIREFSGLVAPLLGPLNGATFLDLTVGAEVEPRLGLVFNQLQIGEGSDDPCWNYLLDGFEDSGICSREKKNFLLDWPKVDRSSAHSGDEFRMKKGFDLKVVYLPGHPISAKAYLSFAQLKPPLFPRRQ